MAGGFEHARHLGEPLGHLARDLGAIARVGSSESGSIQTARSRWRSGFVAQVGELDAVRARVGKRRVGCAGAGELGVQLDHVADIDDDQERRAAFGGGQRAGVVLGLAAGAQHRVVEALAVGLPELLGFQHERRAAVAVDEAAATRCRRRARNVTRRSKT